MSKNNIQCNSCKFQFFDIEEGRKRCIALRDKAHEEAQKGIYQCPFYKQRKEVK